MTFYSLRLNYHRPRDIRGRMGKIIAKKSFGTTTRPQLERMCAIITRLQKGDYPSGKALARALEVTSKTIQRDIEFLKSRHGTPIEYDPYKYGYYLTEPVTGFPLLALSEGEIVALLLAEKALAQYHGTPLEQPLRLTCQKLIDSLKGEFSISWGDLDAAISFRGIESNPIDPVLFKDLNMAVKACREVSFEYCKLRARRYEARRLYPYHLLCHEHQWYVIGYDQMRGQERTFMLGRMRSLEVSNTNFIKPKRFDPLKALTGSFGIYSGRDPVEIRIWFDSFAARLIQERLWHHSQRIRRLDRDQIELTLRLTSTIEIVPWVLRWGTHAKALAPEELVETLRTTAQAVAAQYANSAV